VSRDRLTRPILPLRLLLGPPSGGVRDVFVLGIPEVRLEIVHGLPGQGLGVVAYIGPGAAARTGAAALRAGLLARDFAAGLRAAALALVLDFALALA